MTCRVPDRPAALRLGTQRDSPGLARRRGGVQAQQRARQAVPRGGPEKKIVRRGCRSWRAKAKASCQVKEIQPSIMPSNTSVQVPAGARTHHADHAGVAARLDFVAIVEPWKLTTRARRRRRRG